MPYHRRRRSSSASSADSRGSNTPPPAYSRSNARPRRSSPARRPAPPAPSRRPDPRLSAPRPPVPQPTSSRRRHQSSSQPLQNRSPPPANPRSRTSRNRAGGSRAPPTTSGRRRSPSPSDTLGPWDAISRDGTPPPGHPDRNRNRSIRVVAEIGNMNFACDVAHTDQEHREQLAVAEENKQRILACGERYIRALQQGSGGDLHDAFSDYSQCLGHLAGIELHIACLKGSQRGDRSVWEHLREISENPDDLEIVIQD
ncbi:uncharacterized protein B0J16DRAFT_416560 [Fusarium flagelliforme]|uniref:uncharacterized protein n=1 Tax=Fusarium flagelliforme TaxID=2675880 RepID=UPI001E8D0878|nr:uncharacterized protein B0J16DRAFT_416560 [Fusarium flagelliforme]KAH7183510.1 hypothetical protein B0J16DRAFT_416560 [Fusarium flagelliforme]